jgi:HPt (histidine-containing phosphotransfer) domain-containing protein
MYAEVPDEAAVAIDLDQLLVRCLGNLEFAERIIQIFQERFDKDLDELDRMLEAGDSDGVACLAHRLRGASANAAAPALETRVAQIELLARQDCLDAVQPRLVELRREWDMLRDSLPMLGSADGSAAG